MEFQVSYNATIEHNYSLLASIAGIKVIDDVCSSREIAEKRMHKLMKKMKLQVNEIEDDKHEKTYICNHGVVFQINREY